MAKQEDEVLSPQILRRNTSVNLTLVESVAELEEALKRLGVAAKPKYRVIHPFDSHLLPSPAAQGGGIRLANRQGA